jgi:hypothetical protein
VQDPGDAADGQRQPVRRHPVGEHRDGRRRRRDARERQRAGHPRLDDAQPTGGDRDLGEQLRRAVGEQRERQPRPRVDGLERRQEGEEVEQPPAHRGGDRDRPAPTERAAHEQPLLGQALGKVRRAGMPGPDPPQCGRHRPADPAHDAIADHEQRTEGEQEREDHEGERAGVQQAVGDPAAGDERGQRQEGQRGERREQEDRPRRQTGGDCRPRQRGLPQHPVLERGRGGGAAGNDAPERAARQLGRGDREPAARVQREALHGPQARPARDLRDEDGDPPPRRDVLEVAPAAEHVDDRRADAVQRQRGDGEPEDAASHGPAGAQSGSRRTSMSSRPSDWTRSMIPCSSAWSRIGPWRTVSTRSASRSSISNRASTGSLKRPRMRNSYFDAAIA